MRTRVSYPYPAFEYKTAECDCETCKGEKW